MYLVIGSYSFIYMLNCLLSMKHHHHTMLRSLLPHKGQTIKSQNPLHLGFSELKADDDFIGDLEATRKTIILSRYLWTDTCLYGEQLSGEILECYIIHLKLNRRASQQFFRFPRVGHQ